MHKESLTEKERKYAAEALLLGSNTTEIAICILISRLAGEHAVVYSRAVVEEGPIAVQRELTEIKVGIRQTELKLQNKVITEAIAETGLETESKN